jgi:hypothetical protein
MHCQEVGSKRLDRGIGFLARLPAASPIAGVPLDNGLSPSH